MNALQKLTSDTPDWLKQLCAGVNSILCLLRGDLVCVQIIGSSSEKILRHEYHLVKDIDLLFTVYEEFSRGDILFDFRDFMRRLKPYQEGPSLNLNLSYNGLPAVPTKLDEGAITIDLIPQKYSDIETQFPAAVLDVAKRKRVLLYGNDVYESLEKCKLTFKLIRERIEITQSYINREMKNNKQRENLLLRYLAKSAILLSSFLIIEDNSSIDKEIIVSELSNRFLHLKDDLQLFLKLYQTSEIRPLTEVEGLYFRYISRLLETYHEQFPEN